MLPFFWVLWFIGLRRCEEAASCGIFKAAMCDVHWGSCPSPFAAWTVLCVYKLKELSSPESPAQAMIPSSNKGNVEQLFGEGFCQRFLSRHCLALWQGCQKGRISRQIQGSPHFIGAPKYTDAHSANSIYGICEINPYFFRLKAEIPASDVTVLIFLIYFLCLHYFQLLFEIQFSFI